MLLLLWLTTLQYFTQSSIASHDGYICLDILDPKRWSELESQFKNLPTGQLPFLCPAGRQEIQADSRYAWLTVIRSLVTFLADPNHSSAMPGSGLPSGAGAAYDKAVAERMRRNVSFAHKGQGVVIVDTLLAF